MAIEISNLSAAACHVDTQAMVAGTPAFKGKGRANAGFAPFAPTPAPPDKSERLGPGSFRLHLTQSFAFAGDASPLATVHVTFNKTTGIPGIQAFVTGPATGGGSDVFVTILNCCAGSDGGDGGDDVAENDSGPVAQDWDFTLLVLNFPVQLTGV